MRNGFFRTQHTYGLDLPPPYLPSIPRVRVRVCARPRSPPNENMGAFFFSFFFFSFFHFFPSRLLYVYTDDTLSLARPLFLSLYIICEMRACVYFSIYVCIYPCTIRCRVLLRDNAPSATTTTAPLFAGPSETREEKKTTTQKLSKPNASLFVLYLVLLLFDAVFPFGSRRRRPRDSRPSAEKRVQSGYDIVTLRPFDYSVSPT